MKFQSTAKAIDVEIFRSDRIHSMSIVDHSFTIENKKQRTSSFSMSNFHILSSFHTLPDTRSDLRMVIYTTKAGFFSSGKKRIYVCTNQTHGLIAGTVYTTVQCQRKERGGAHHQLNALLRTPLSIGSNSIHLAPGRRWLPPMHNANGPNADKKRYCGRKSATKSLHGVHNSI